MSKTTFTVNRENLKITMERTFDVPRELSWKVITDPIFISQYWGPEPNSIIVERMDMKVDGEWRYIQHDEKGNAHVFFGFYDKIDPLKLISNTFNYEPMGRGHEVTETITLEDTDGSKTRIRNVSTYKTKEDLEGMIQWGMKSVVAKWERLATLLMKLKESEKIIT